METQKTEFDKQTYIKKIQFEAFNNETFKSILKHISAPLEVPVEFVQMNGEWPTDEDLKALSEPIQIPCPQPVVVEAPKIQILKEDDSQLKFEVKELTSDEKAVRLYPKPNDNSYFENFNLKQVNL